MKAFALAALLLALTAPTATAADDPQAQGTLTYARTGGIAGVNDNFRIKRDGWSLLNGASSGCARSSARRSRSSSRRPSSSGPR